MSSTSPDECDFVSMIIELCAIHSDANEVSSQLKNFFKPLRTPGNLFSTKILVYFVAKCLRQISFSYEPLLKENCLESHLMSNFRVGIE